MCGGMEGAVVTVVAVILDVELDVELDAGGGRERRMGAGLLVSNDNVGTAISFIPIRLDGTVEGLEGLEGLET